MPTALHPRRVSADLTGLHAPLAQIHVQGGRPAYGAAGALPPPLSTAAGAERGSDEGPGDASAASLTTHAICLPASVTIRFMGFTRIWKRSGIGASGWSGGCVGRPVGQPAARVISLGVGFARQTPCLAVGPCSGAPDCARADLAAEACMPRRGSRPPDRRALPCSV